MFEQTGVIEPRLDIAAMGQLAASYRRLASGLTSAHTDATDSVAHVLASNDGPAAQQFSQSETGTGSIAVHLGELAEAATRTSNAYARGAVGGLQATVAMQVVAYSRMGQYLQMVERRTPSVFVAIFVQVVRFQLLQLESRGATAVESAFADLDLPAEHALVRENDTRGNLDDGVADRLAKLAVEDPEKVREMFQTIADDFADQNGIPRKQIQWVDLHGAYGRRDGAGNIQLDPDFLTDPSVLLHTVVHEMEHSRQYEGMAMDPNSTTNGAGMTPEEAARWRELNQTYVRNKGDNPSTSVDEAYRARPVEVDARRAGRDFVNNLTLEELEKYL